MTEIMEQEQVIIEVAEQYVKAFKEVNPKLITDYFAPECIKIGYFFNFEEDKWEDKSIHNYNEIKQWVAAYNVEGIMPDSEIKTTLLDVQDKIAVVKLEVEWAPRMWGCDYVLLSKDNGNWLITNIIYQTVI